MDCGAVALTSRLLDMALRWAQELSDAAKSLPREAQEDIQDQLTDAVYQIDFLRKAQLVQLQLTGNVDFLDDAAAATTAVPQEQSPLSEAPLLSSELSPAGEAYLEMLFSMQDVLNDTQLQCVAVQLVCSAQTIRDWFAEKRQAVRTVCSRLHKKLRLAGAGAGSRAVAVTKQFGPGAITALVDTCPVCRHLTCMLR